MASLSSSASSLSRRSLGSQIAHHLREEIVLGRLAAGTAVSQQWLCERYGTSRMPVRDALGKLAAEGLVVTTPGGHTIVAELTPTDIVDVFEIQAIVQGRAARRAAGRATEADLAELGELHEAMVAAQRAQELERLTELNWIFHKRINLLSGSAKLVAMLRTLSLSIPQTYLSELPDWAGQTIEDHAGIIEALRERDGDRADALAAEHVRGAGGNLARYLAGKAQATAAA